MAKRKDATYWRATALGLSGLIAWLVGWATEHDGIEDVGKVACVAAILVFEVWNAATDAIEKGKFDE